MTDGPISQRACEEVWRNDLLALEHADSDSAAGCPVGDGATRRRCRRGCRRLLQLRSVFR